MGFLSGKDIRSSLVSLSIFIFISMLMRVSIAAYEGGLSAPDTNYTQGGADWGQFCTQGTRQSPINLISNRGQRNKEIKVSHEFHDIRNGLINYDRAELKVDYIDGEIEFEAEDDDDDSWNSHHFTFHCPAEHQIDGEKFDLEMQIYFYHEESVRELVLAILFKLDNKAPDNDFITSLKLDNITSGNPQTISNVPIKSFIDGIFKKDMFTYLGSLTVPPCFEAPEWLVVKDPVKINSNQLQDFRDLWPDNQSFAKGRGNNRLIMPLHNRKIEIVRMSPKTEYPDHLWVIIGGCIGGTILVIIIIAIASCIYCRKRAAHQRLIEEKEENKSIDSSNEGRTYYTGLN